MRASCIDLLWPNLKSAWKWHKIGNRLILTIMVRLLKKLFIRQRSETVLSIYFLWAYTTVRCWYTKDDTVVYCRKLINSNFVCIKISWRWVVIHCHHQTTNIIILTVAPIEQNIKTFLNILPILIYVICIRI